MMARRRKPQKRANAGTRSKSKTQQQTQSERPQTEVTVSVTQNVDVGSQGKALEGQPKSQEERIPSQDVALMEEGNERKTSVGESSECKPSEVNPSEDKPSGSPMIQDESNEDQPTDGQSWERQMLEARSTQRQTTESQSTEGYDQEDTEDTDDARTIDMQNEIQTIDETDETQMMDVADSESTTSASTLECLDEEFDALDRSRGRWSAASINKAKRSITPSPSSTTSSRNSTPHGGGCQRQSLSPIPLGSDSVNPTFPIRPGISWRVGARIEAMDFIEKWYQARIVEINADELEVLIHFEGWNARYDEWVPMKSERIRYLPRHSERRDGKKAVPKTDYKIGECVFAKWTDCRHYAARITIINPSGSYEVMFFDGYKKTIQPINIKYMPPEVQIEYGNAGLLPPYPKSLKRRIRDQAKKGAATAPENNQPPQPQLAQERRKRSSSLRESLMERPKASTSVVIKDTKPVVSGTKRKKSTSGSTPTAKRSMMEPSTAEVTLVDAATASIRKDKKPPGPAATSESADTGTAELGLARDLGITANPNPSSAPILETIKPKQVPPSEARPQEDLATEEALPSQVKLGPSSRSPSQVTGHAAVAVSPDEAEGETARMCSGKPFPTSTLEGSQLVAPHVEAPTGPDVMSPGVPITIDGRNIKAPKAFKVEADHNQYKCPFDGCPKAFRKESLVEYHIKYYHTIDGRPVLPPPPRKRKKTNSVCSTDSEISVGGRSSSSKRRKRLSEVSLGSLPDTTLDRLQLHIEDSVGSDMLEESLGGSMEIDHHEALAADDSIALGEEAGPLKKDEEVVNCICQLIDESGLMIQCEVCLCWQHASCMELTDETLPKRYVCYVCTNPPGIRDSARFMYVQDWFREGRLSCFNFLPTPEHEEVNASRSLNLHDLVGETHNVNRVLDSLRRKIHILQEKNHPEFHFWKKNWDREIERSRQDAEVAAMRDATPSPGPTASSSKMADDMKQSHGHSTQGDPHDPETQGEATNGGVHEGPLSQGGASAHKALGGAAMTPAAGVCDPGAPPSSSLHDYSMNSKSAPASPQEAECEGDELESDVAVVTSDEDPVANCEKNLLEHIMNMQDRLAERMEVLDQHITAMEELDQARIVHKDVLADVPIIKKKLHHIVNDLVKVKRMSRFH